MQIPGGVGGRFMGTERRLKLFMLAIMHDLHINKSQFAFYLPTSLYPAFLIKPGATAAAPMLSWSLLALLTLIDHLLSPHIEYFAIHNRHIHLIEFKYCEDARPGAELEASQQQQHSELCNQLQGAKITLHTILLVRVEQ
eukprot:1099511-Pelagomonas_calceolata.AAC.1